MRIDLTLAQLETLEAAARAALYRRPEHTHFGLWRIEQGHAVTLSAMALFSRGLIIQGEPAPDGKVLAILTDLGRTVLDELAARGPNPTKGTQ